jgi:hypothetical protein
MKHGQDARATPAGKGFCKTLTREQQKSITGGHDLNRILISGSITIFDGQGTIRYTLWHVPS